ncbi:TfoX/Sxy family protein [Arcticibacter tournemirensis]
MKRMYDLQMADRIRELLVDHEGVIEKTMFNGLCFMVDDKMLICVTNDDLLCRIGEASAAEELGKGTCRQMIMRGRASKDFVYVPIEGATQQKDLKHWVELCLDFNPQAKSSKKSKRNAP